MCFNQSGGFMKKLIVLFLLTVFFSVSSMDLFQACEKGNSARVSELISQGADLGARDQGGLTALHRAAMGGDDGIVAMLLEHGANINDVFNGVYTALHVAVLFNRDGVVRTLLSRNPVINVARPDQTTTLHYASAYGQFVLVKFLLEHNVSVDLSTASGLTALHYAASVGNVRVVEYLLEQGARLDAADNMPYTALHTAVLKNKPNIVELLLKHGAVINAVRADGLASLHAAAFNGHERVVKFLLWSMQKEELNLTDKSGSTALCYAAQEGHLEIVKLLLERGVNVNIANEALYTALHLAVLKGHAPIVKLLHDNGAIINVVGSDGSTTLHTAALNGHESVVRFLLDCGIDPNIPGKDGSTALHCAAQEGHAGIVKLLLQNGASVYVLDAADHTVLEVALSANHPDVVQLLSCNSALKGLSALLRDTRSLSGDIGQQLGQISDQQKRTDFLRLILGVDNIKDVFKRGKLIYLSKLHRAANSLYVYSRWGALMANILFLCRELKRLDWSYGIVRDFDILEAAPQEVQHSVEPHFVRQQTMSIWTTSGIGAASELMPCLTRKPVRFNGDTMGIIDEYLKDAGEDEEVRLLAHAVKQRYVNLELNKQLCHLVRLVRQFITQQQIAHDVSPLDKRLIMCMAPSFDLINGNLVGDELNPDVLSDAGAFLQFYHQLNLIAHVAKKGFVHFDRIYVLIHEESNVCCPSSHHIRCNYFDNIDTLPDAINLVWDIESFEQYFVRNAEQGQSASSSVKTPECAAQAVNDAGTEQVTKKQQQGTPKCQYAAGKGRKGHGRGRGKPERPLSEPPSPLYDVSSRPESPASAPVSPTVQSVSPSPSPRHYGQSKKRKSSASEPASPAMNPSSNSVGSSSPQRLPSPVVLPMGCTGAAANTAGHGRCQQDPVKIKQYDWRVRRWFNHNFAKTQTPHDVLYHAFSPQADTFILGHGYRTVRQNVSHVGMYDTSYSLPGKVIFPEGKQRLAIFTCTLDSNGICYHRGIAYVGSNQFTKLLGGESCENLVGWDIDDSAVHTPEGARQQDELKDGLLLQGGVEKGGTETKVTRHKFYVEIEDSYNRVRLILFKIKSLRGQTS
jgi:ankyrin repeat protein